MAYPIFYFDQPATPGEMVTLSEDNSKHIAGVLRMSRGDTIQLANGKGLLRTAVIVDDHRKRCVVKIEKQAEVPPADTEIHIGISLLKNAGRFEWFLEKATEIGITHIHPLLCDRTEKQHFRQERMHGIMVSAMLQSQQTWLPVMPEPLRFSTFIESINSSITSRFVAHCEEDKKIELQDALRGRSGSLIILIGPEGDFSTGEISAAKQAGFIPVSLGDTRLRAETAALVAATLLKFSAEQTS